MSIAEPWDDMIEQYMQKTLEICVMNSRLHMDTGYHFKRKRVMWGLPAVLVPIIMSPISLMIGWASEAQPDSITAADYVNACGFLVSGVITGVYNFFDYSTKMAKHFHQAGIYDLIKSDVESEMVKHRQFRIKADVFLTRIKMLMDNAAQTDPVIPQKILERNELSKQLVREKKSELIRIEISPGNSRASNEAEQQRNPEQKVETEV